MLRRVLLMCLPAGIGLFVTGLYSRYLISFGENYDSGAQISYALSHPVEVVYTVIRTAVLKAEGWSGSMTGDYIGLLNIRTAQIVMIMIFILLTAVTMNTGAVQALKNMKSPVIMASAAVIGIGLVMATMYATWTPVADTLILGIQGRYMLAFLPLIMLWICLGRTYRGTAIQAAPPETGSRNDQYAYSVSDRYGYAAHLVLLAIDAFAILDIYRFLL